MTTLRLNTVLYGKFALKSFQKLITYRMEYFVSVINALLYIFVFTSVWRALLADGREVGGLGVDQMVAYAVLATLVKSSFGRNENLVGARVRSGDIAFDLLKPINFTLYVMADLLGANLFQLLGRVLPLLFFSLFLFDISLPLETDVLARFAPAYLGSFLLYFFLTYCISLTAFLFKENFPFFLLYFALITLLSGAILPVDFLPGGLAEFARWTPFPYLYYYPTMLLVKPEATGLVWSRILLFQAGYIIIFYLVSRWLWYLGMKKLDIQGG